MKIVFCVPTVTKPYKQLLESIKEAVPVLDAAGIQHQCVFSVGSPYISHARSKMLRKALDAKADKIIFLDHDISFNPEALMKLITVDGDVVAGTYRFKKEHEEYMGMLFSDENMRPVVREDGCIHAEWVPAGFLMVTKEAVSKFMKAYPDLSYGCPYSPHTDLFNHGAHKGTWYGEDYAFSRNWNDCGGKIWLIPDIEIIHHSETKEYVGNFHIFMRKQPGGDLS